MFELLANYLSTYQLHVFAAILLIVGFSVSNQTYKTSFYFLGLIVFGYLYFSWRFLETIENFWHLIILIIELLSYFFSFLYIYLAQNFKQINRSKEADIYEKELLLKKTFPLVDVYIPTYNEPENIVKKTIIGALNIDYPNHQVYVLDDGKRDWLKKLSADLGANYIRRENNENAKAGNMNHALTLTKGEYVAIFDADFIPFSNFLKRTIGFFKDKKIAMVQTPQFFYNHDPIEFNSQIFQDLGDEQRLWFDDIIVARDFYNVATSCGSCSVVRRKSLDSIGGFPEETITEDYDTSIQFLEKGLITRYLNERLSVGLAAEDFNGFFGQRKRWAIGNISVWRNHFKRGVLLPFWNYIVLFDWYYFIQIPAKIFLAFIPLLFLYFGIPPFYIENIDQLIIHHWAFLFANFLVINHLATNAFVPFLSNAISYICSLNIFPAVLRSFSANFTPKFEVTPKGITEEKPDIYAKNFRAAIIFFNWILFVGIVALILNLSKDQLGSVVVASIWTVSTIISFYIGQKLLIPGIRHRKEERFDIATIFYGYKNLHEEKPEKIQIINISLGGILVKGNGLSELKFVRIKESSKPIAVQFIESFREDNVDYARFSFIDLNEESYKDLFKLIYNKSYIPIRRTRFSALKVLFK